VEGVRDVEGLRAREHGSYVIVDVVIAVDPGITVAEGHKIGRRVKQTLLDAFTFVNDVFVHVNPLRQK
jgi:divalent metal cation (Fe/Co/Zn/Cd) transporter